MKKDIELSIIGDFIENIFQNVGKFLSVTFTVIGFLLKALTIIAVLFMVYDAPGKVIPALLFFCFIVSLFYAIKDKTVWDLGWFIVFLIILSIIF